MHLQYIVVGGRKGRLQQALKRLGHPRDFGACSVLDAEVPGPLVLGKDPADFLAVDHKPKPDLAEHVLLHDRADFVAGSIADDHP